MGRLWGNCLGRSPNWRLRSVDRDLRRAAYERGLQGAGAQPLAHRNRPRRRQGDPVRERRARRDIARGGERPRVGGAADARAGRAAARVGAHRLECSRKQHDRLVLAHARRSSRRRCAHAVFGWIRWGGSSRDLRVSCWRWRWQGAWRCKWCMA